MNDQSTKNRAKSYRYLTRCLLIFLYLISQSMGELSHLLNVRSAGVNHQGWKLPAAFVIGVETPLSPMPKPTRDGHTHGGAPCVVCQFLAFAGASLVSASSIGSYPIIVSLFVTMNLNQAKTLPLQRHLSVAAPRAPPIAA